MKLSQISYILKNLQRGQIQEVFYNSLQRPKTFMKVPISRECKKYIYGNSVVIEPENNFLDHIEMSGERVSAIVSYGADENGFLRLFRHVTLPSFRLKSDLTFSSFCFNGEENPVMTVDGARILGETAVSFKLKGVLTAITRFGGLRIERKLFPLPDDAGLGEKTTIVNVSKFITEFTVEAKKRNFSKKSLLKNGRAEYGEYLYNGQGERYEGETVFIKPGGEFSFYTVYGACEKGTEFVCDVVGQEKKRDAFVEKVLTENALYGVKSADLLYSFAALRGCESIFETENGLLHSPGGKFYAAIWANDQMEYAAPAFALIGNKKGIDATKNAVNLYEKYAVTGVNKALPSSLVAGGRKPLGIAGDRGDTAMVGVGTALFLLYLGDRKYALEKLPFVDYCVEYCKSKLTEKGVVKSDSDELEGRFPSGKCNLATNVNYLELLRYAAYLHRDLGRGDGEDYLAAAEQLEKDIESYFGGKVEGYETYRYYEKNRKLRSWICLPLDAGITERAEGTCAALREKLYSNGKMLTASNKDTVWDRSLLYAIKGLFRAGQSKTAAEMLEEYSLERLLGVHSPYPYEAFPEGNGSHLSAESLLYIRAIAEGMFGIRPTGLGKIIIRPTEGLDADLKGLCLSGIKINIAVRNNVITVLQGKEIMAEGEGELELNFAPIAEETAIEETEKKVDVVFADENEKIAATANEEIVEETAAATVEETTELSVDTVEETAGETAAATVEETTELSVDTAEETVGEIVATANEETVEETAEESVDTAVKKKDEESADAINEMPADDTSMKKTNKETAKDKSEENLDNLTEEKEIRQ